MKDDSVIMQTASRCFYFCERLKCEQADGRVGAWTEQL